MNVIEVPIDSIKAAPYNPRTISQHEFESLQRSIDEFGFVEPVVVNKRNQTIVGGHMRVNAARELGFEKVPIVFVDLDAQREAALNVALNKISGEFDTDMLAELLADLDDEARLLTGFSDDEIAKLQDGWVDHEELKDEPKDKETRYTLGQLETLKNTFKSVHQDHSVNAFIDWLRREVNKE